MPGFANAVVKEVWLRVPLFIPHLVIKIVSCQLCTSYL